MLPTPNNFNSPPRGRFSFTLVTRNVFARLSRWWHVLLVFGVVLWFSGSTYAPRRYRFRIFKASRPAGGPRPPPIVLAGDLWAGRAHEVRKAFVHAYTGYQAHALPHDELNPISGEHVDKCVHFRAGQKEMLTKLPPVFTDGA